MKNLLSWPGLPYVVPFLVFLMLTSAESGSGELYPIYYTAKILIVTIVLIGFRRQLPRFAAPTTRGLGLALLLGILLGFTWVPLDRITLHFAILGVRQGYNPLAEITDLSLRYGFIAIRFYGLVIVVPIIEELFYRNFLLRLVIDLDNFERVPVGSATATSVGFNVILFASSHPEWLAALLFGLVMCWTVIRTKNVSACIVAHAVTNLVLGLTVMHSHEWKYW